MRPLGKPLHQKPARRQTQRITPMGTEAHRQGSPQEPVPWETQQSLTNCRRLLWAGLRVENSRRPRQRGPPHFCEFHLQELDQVPTVSVREKSPCAPGCGREEGTFFKCPEHSVLPNKGCSQETSAAGASSEPNRLGERQYQLPPPPAILPRLRGRN